MNNKYKLKRPFERKVRFSEKENEFLTLKLAASPRNNFQNFARLALLSGEMKFYDYSDLQQLNGQINRIGNNINQLAKFAHMFEEISAEDIAQLTDMMTEIKTLVHDRLDGEIRREIIAEEYVWEENDGSHETQSDS